MICECCGAEFAQRTGPGRPRKYCTDACRVKVLRKVHQPAWNNRRSQEKKDGRWI